jgi:hypothetical protein
MVLIFAFYTYSKHNLGIDLFELYLGIGIVGYLLYFIVPACGPSYAFGKAFPYSLPPVDAARLTNSVFQSAPNAMPSLHFANALVLYWNSRPWRRLHLAMLAFLILTGIATLGTGEHYLTDLVVAVPFATAMQAFFSRSSARRAIAISCSVLVCSWFVLILVFRVDGVPHWLLLLLTACSVASPGIFFVHRTRPPASVASSDQGLAA